MLGISLNDKRVSDHTNKMNWAKKQEKTIVIKMERKTNTSVNCSRQKTIERIQNKQNEQMKKGSSIPIIQSQQSIAMTVDKHIRAVSLKPQNGK